MVAVRGGSAGGGGDDAPNPNVTDLLKRLNLTEDEEAVIEFSKEELDEEAAPVEWRLWGRCYRHRLCT